MPKSGHNLDAPVIAVDEHPSAAAIGGFQMCEADKPVEVVKRWLDPALPSVDMVRTRWASLGANQMMR